MEKTIRIPCSKRTGDLLFMNRNQFLTITELKIKQAGIMETYYINYITKIQKQINIFVRCGRRVSPRLR